MGAVVDVVALLAGLLVKGVRGLADADDSQARFSLTIVGFATAFELVVLAWSAADAGAAKQSWLRSSAASPTTSP